jgi:hypothetical protein
MVKIRIGIEKKHPNDEKYQNQYILVAQKFENRIFSNAFFKWIFHVVRKFIAPILGGTGNSILNKLRINLKNICV